MKNKFGIYIQQLMSTVLDQEQDDFVRNLAMSELKRLKVDLSSFITKHETDEDNEKTIKKLLQEKKNDGK